MRERRKECEVEPGWGGAGVARREVEASEDPCENVEVVRGTGWASSGRERAVCGMGWRRGALGGRRSSHSSIESSFERRLPYFDPGTAPLVLPTSPTD